MSAFIVRLASQKDLEALLKIEQSCFKSDRFSRRQFSYLLTRAKAKTWVAVLKGEVCAYCTALLPVITRPARIYSLAVLPEYRGRGMAQHLIGYALDEVALRRYKECVLEVRASDLPTIRLYEKHGFTVRNRLKAYYEDNEDALRMSRIIERKSMRGKKIV